jgi:hypothetical protein
MDAEDGRFGERLTPCSFLATPTRYPCPKRLRDDSVQGLKALYGEVVIPCAEAQGFYPGYASKAATIHARASP